MREIENCVEVRVSGPKEQMKVYLDWIQKSGEYRYSMGIDENEGDPVFFLTPDVQSHECWKFSSSNLKHKTRLYQRLNKEVLKYRVNYMVYYGTHHLSDEIEFDLNEKDYDQAIYPELVRAFNPMPEPIACTEKVSPSGRFSYTRHASSAVSFVEKTNSSTASVFCIVCCAPL